MLTQLPQWAPEASGGPSGAGAGGAGGRGGVDWIARSGVISSEADGARWSPWLARAPDSWYIADGCYSW
jgi:hypothetical protein